MRSKTTAPSLRFKEFKQDWTIQEFGSGVEPYVEKVDASTDLPVYSSSRTGLYAQEDYFADRRVTNEGEYGVVPFGYFVYRHMSDDLTFKFNINDVEPKIAVSKEYPVFRTKIWDGKFIRYKLNHSVDFKKFAATQKLGGTRTRLYFKNLCLWKTFLPSIEEQQKIADFLSSVDKKISLLKEKHALLTKYKKGVMQKLFKQEIRFKDDNGNDFPDWEFKKGNKIFDAISNKNHDSDLPILAITQEHGAIPRDLINYQVQVTEGSVAGYKVVDKGDFIISLRSFQGGIEYSNYKGICSPAYIILRPSIKVNDDFYRYYLKTGNFIQEMKKRLEGIRDGKILSYKYFSEINLPSPCVEEQQKIAEFLLALDKKLDAVNQQIELTQTFKKGLLQQMFV